MIFSLFKKKSEPKGKEKDDLHYYMNKSYRKETFDHSEVYHRVEVIDKIKDWITSF